MGTRRTLRKRTAFDKQMFPLDAFDQLGAQFVPRWTSHGEETLAAYFRALEKVGPVVLISHSQGANFAMEAVQRHPEFFRCVVLIEPASAPVSNADKLRPAAKVPHLFVWGDFIDQSPLWRQYRQAVQRYMNNLLALGGQLAEMDLPALNICGNSHVPMMDRNSDQVAERIEAWIRETI